MFGASSSSHLRDLGVYKYIWFSQWWLSNLIDPLYVIHFWSAESNECGQLWGSQYYNSLQMMVKFLLLLLVSHGKATVPFSRRLIAIPMCVIWREFMFWSLTLLPKDIHPKQLSSQPPTYNISHHLAVHCPPAEFVGGARNMCAIHTPITVTMGAAGVGQGDRRNRFLNVL